MTTKGVLKTPNIKQAAIDYYGCSTLQGITMGSGYTFETSLLLNEFFSAYSYINLYFTDMSVALIKDTK